MPGASAPAVTIAMVPSAVIRAGAAVVWVKIFSRFQLIAEAGAASESAVSKSPSSIARPTAWLLLITSSSAVGVGYC